MDSFARQPDDDRKALLQEAASRRDSTEIILEKDFWVCWTLKRLFSNPVLAPYLTFKGGTSLSKAYGLIERFSEDIDLTISRSADFLKETPDPMDADISGKERARRLKTLSENAQIYVRDITLLALQADIGTALGQSTNWNIVLDDEDSDQQTILFHYPKVFDYKVFVPGVTRPIAQPIARPIASSPVRGNWRDGYIRPVVRLEFGARGDITPSEKRSIKPYAAEELPDLFDDSCVEVGTLAAERTFWEKATILHALHHGSKMRDCMSRHYYDTFMLDQHGIADKALLNPDLLESVVHNKSLLFRDAKASYDTAVIGRLKLLPTDEQRTHLKQDYEKMAEMFMGEYPDFDTVMNGLSKLEQKINST